jgi:Ca2+/Na+ antiporter
LFFLGLQVGYKGARLNGIIGITLARPGTSAPDQFSAIFSLAHAQPPAISDCKS